MGYKQEARLVPPISPQQQVYMSLRLALGRTVTCQRSHLLPAQPALHTVRRTIMSTSTLPPLQRPESLANSTAPAKLHLYTVGTPNGVKVSILLEELLLAYPDLANSKLSYDFSALSFQNVDQKKPEFLAINPNGRIPALVDDNVTDPETGKGLAVFESASILLWLVEQYDKEFKFSFSDPILRSKALSWIFFAHGGVGPMQGQANHFL